MIRDLNSCTTAVVGLTAAAVSSNTTTNGAVIDLADAGGVLFVVNAASYSGDRVFTGTITVGNAADLSDGVVATDLQGGVVATDLQGGVVATNLQGGVVATNLQGGVVISAAGVCKVGVRLNGFRYARLNLVSTGTTGGATVSAAALLFDLKIEV